MKTPEDYAKEININNVVTSDYTDVVIFRQRIADVIRKAIEEEQEAIARMIEDESYSYEYTAAYYVRKIRDRKNST